MRWRCQRLVAGLTLGLGALAGPVPAATPIATSASFAVQATVAPGCWVVGSPTQLSGVGFGLLDFGTHPAVQAGTHNASIAMAGSPARVQCTPGATVTLTIDGGQNVLSGQRRMRSGSHYLPYHLTTQPGGSTLLLPGAALTVDASAGPTLLPIYGRAAMPGAGAAAGHYTDTLQVVFSW